MVPTMSHKKSTEPKILTFVMDRAERLSPTLVYDSGSEETAEPLETANVRLQQNGNLLQEKMDDQTETPPTTPHKLNKAKAIGFVPMGYENAKKKRKKTKFERKRSKVGSICSNDVEFDGAKDDQDSEDSAEDIFGSLVSMVTLGRSISTERKLSIHECIRKRSFRYVKQCIEDDHTNVNKTNKQGQFPIHISTQYGYLDIVQLLLDNGADVNVATKNEGNTSLHVCSKFNNMEIARTLILHGCNVDASGTNGDTALHISSSHGYHETAKLLLDSQANVNSTNEDQQTPLHLASIHGSVEMVRLLISRGADILAKDCNRNTPLICACSSGHLKLADILIVHAAQHGYSVPDYLSKQNTRGETALHAATNKRHGEIVQMLLQKGSDVTSVKVNGQSALHIAAMNGSTDIAMNLISHGALLRLADNDNMSPLHRAALNNQVETMKLLLQKGCPPDICDEDSYTPLMCAAWKGNCDAGNLLIKEGASLETIDYNMKTCLHLAVEMDHVDFVRMLLKHTKSDDLVNATSRKDWTALHYAAENGNIEIMRCLLNAGVSLMRRDHQARIPLHIAAANGKLKFIKAILQEQPDMINESDRKGMTPLLLASKHNHHHVVRYLLKMGADISSRNSFEMTAISLAAMKGNVHVISVLLQFHANVNTQDKDWNTALHICCIYNQADAANLLLKANANFCIRNRKRRSVLDLAAQYKREAIAASILNNKNWEKAMNLRDGEGNTPMNMLIERLPSCAEIVLNKCVRYSHTDNSHPDCAVTYDFRYIDPGPDDVSTRKQRKRYFGLRTIVNLRRENLSKHELIQAILKLKWEKLGRPGTGIALTFYMVFVTVYAIYVKYIRDPALTPSYWGQDGCPVFNYSENSSDQKTRPPPVQGFENGRYRYTSAALWCLEMYLLLYIVFEGILKCYEIYMKRLDFCMELTNWNDFVAFSATLIFIMPPGRVPCAFHWNCGVLGILLSYLRLITLLQRLDYVGIYLTMFWTTVKSLLKAMSVYVLFMFAFSFTFRITFGEISSFSTAHGSFVTTFAMTMGEFGRENIFSSDLSIFEASSYILFIGFLFTMPLVVVNLMIGISIGDIEAIRASSDLKRMSMQVDVTYSVESKLPVLLQRKVYSSTYTHFPNKPQLGFLRKLRHFLFGEPSSGFLSDEVSDDTSLSESIGDIRDCVDTQKDFQSVVLIVLQQHGDLLRELAKKNDIYAENLDNVNFLVKGHGDMVNSRTPTPVNL